jgi:hypothetical protein
MEGGQRHPAVINFGQTNQPEIGSSPLPLRFWGVTMSVYRFVLRNAGGEVEELGFMPLPDDEEAVAFGETMVRELVAGNSTPYADSVMEVSDGKRSVGNIQAEKM